MKRKFALIPAAILALAACTDAPETDISATTGDESGAVTADNATLPTVAEAPDGMPDQTPTRPERPVRVGLDGPDMDACGTYSEVSGLNPAGDNYLSVRSRPSADAAELDRLSPETGVSVCGGENGFAAIVYAGEGQDRADCGTGSPVATEQDYDGPCRSGWVSEDYLAMLAG